MTYDGKLALDYIYKLDAQTPVPNMFADKLITLLKTYYVTGGMPEVVANWIENKDVAEAERIQQMILDSYELDFAKHAPADFPKLLLIWKSIPHQLAKENENLFMVMPKPGARAKDMEDAIQWLVSAGMKSIKVITTPCLLYNSIF